MVLTKKILIAVYGSLRRGLGNYNYYLKNEKYIGQYETDPIYNLYDLGSFPGLTKNGETSVIMEIFEIDATKLKEIDSLEGFREDTETNHYNREKITTPFGEAYTYFYNHTPSSKLVESGDWTDYIRLKQVLNYYD